MKAIPLIACLALVAAQGRAQTCAPAAGAAPAEGSAAPLSPSAAIPLSSRIASIKAKGLSGDDAIQLGKIETGIAAAQTKGDLQNCQAALDRLFPSAAGSKTAAPAPPDEKGPQQKIPDFQSQAAAYNAATKNPGVFFEGAVNYSASVAGPTPGSVDAGHGGTGSSARPSAYDYINAAPSTTLKLHPFAVPSPSGNSTTPEISDAFIAQNWTPWLNLYGHKASDLTPAVRSSIPALLAQKPGLGGDPSASPAPVDPTPAAQAPAPPADDPMSWKYLEGLINKTNLGENETLIKKLEEESIKHKDGTVVPMLTSIAHYCYAGVKLMLAMVLGIKQPDLGLPGPSAYMALAALKGNPELQKRLHLMPMDLTTFPYETEGELPSRTILIWDHGCAYKDDGHIEFTLPVSMIKNDHLLKVTAFYESGKEARWKPNPDQISHPVLACSDGCDVHWMGRPQPPHKIQEKDSNGYKNLLYFAGEKQCLSAYVPVKDEPVVAAVQTARQSAGASGL